MCATLTVKKFKIQSWENFRHELDSNYWQAIRSVGCKQLHNLLLDPTKTKLVFCSAISSISLADGKYFKDLLNQITITPSDKHEKHLGMKTPLLQPGASWRSKHWRPVKLHEIWHKITALNREVLWLTPGVSKLFFPRATQTYYTTVRGPDILSNWLFLGKWHSTKSTHFSDIYYFIIHKMSPPTGWNGVAGRIWPAGRSLETPGLHISVN